MEKLKMHSPDLTQGNIEKLAALFPNCVTESKAEDGSLKRAIDFDLLRQELSGSIVEGPVERYQLNWPGKRESIIAASSPVAKSLRPARAESVNFDSTENLYIEGDNLDVLKLLQEAYLSKLKVIYIDPPYNTGKDFLYEDDFSENANEYFRKSFQIDSKGERMVANMEANGRFHSDWLSMIYSRLRLARNLLCDSGIVFISIDDNEYANMQRVCDEVFGESNYLATIHVKVRYEGKTLVEDMDFQKLVEQVLVYGKSSRVSLKKKSQDYTYEKFCWRVIEKGVPKKIKLGGKDVSVFGPGEYEIQECEPSTTGLKEIWATGKILDGNSSGRFFRDYLAGRTGVDGLGALYKVSGIGDDDHGFRYFTGPKREGATKGKYFQGVPMAVLSGQKVSRELPISTFLDFADSFGNCRHEGGVDFRDGKKPLRFLRHLLSFVNLENNDVVLDFFSGSGSTAHAVMEHNAVESAKVKFIVVQIPQEISEDSDASQAGFKTIADLGKERLRKAGQKLKSENLTTAPGLDVGFRVLKLDSSNLKPVFYAPDAFEQKNLLDQIDNINEGRTPEDLLFQVLLDWGLELTLPITQESLSGKAVFFVDGNALAACFDQNVTEAAIKSIAEKMPLRAVFRDASFSSDSAKINIEQIFKLLSPSTELRCI